MKNRVRLSESQLRNMVSKAVKKMLKETELSYDMDNFSGTWNRGDRYDIHVDGRPYYRDVPEVSVDKLVKQLQQDGYENIEIVGEDGESTKIGGYEKEEPKYIQWYDEVEETYDMAAMIKSDFNPLQYSVKAKSIQEAIEKGTQYFKGFSRHGEKDVDIYYIKHHGYDGV